jgi:predicted DNA-binding transcriptional regulator YafY
MARLARLVAVLTRSERGVPVEDILTHVLPGEGDPDSKKKALTRDIDHLNALGYDVRNVAEHGASAVYRLRALDNRLRVALTPRQRGELARAALATQQAELLRHLDADAPVRPTRSDGTVAHLPQMDLVLRAAQRHCLLDFEYKGEPRHVHPVAVHSGPSGWYLRGREEGSEIVKEFVVGRMSDVRIGAPGSAEVVAQAERRSLDPLSWQIDPPVEADLEVAAEHRSLVENLLGTPASATGEDPVRLTYVVTHRDVFRWRVYELGTRVRVLGPTELRETMLAELRAAAAVRA